MIQSKQLVQRFLSIAGISIDGPNAWDIQVRNEDFYPRVLSEGSVGFGESYMEGWWDAEALDQFFYRLLRAGLNEKAKRDWRTLLWSGWTRIVNAQRRSRAFNIAQRHYDLGNDLFEVMLDPRMVYSCGYWRRAKDLANAQEDKLDLVCKKLRLSPGMAVLDIGCGWGSFGKFAAERYGARVRGVTVSREQVALGAEKCAGLPVEIQLKDYREIDGLYDRVVSIGMFEHVGYKNYRTYMKVVAKALKHEGLFLLHTFGNTETVHHADPWFEKYIFPGGMAPSISQIGDAIDRLLIMEDWHNFGADYDPTLLAWFERFDRNRQELGARYDEMFYRMWKYYLLSLAGAFRARVLQVWQIVLSKGGVPGGYGSIR